MKKVKLSEESYNKLKDKLISEISYNTVNNADNAHYEIFYDLYDTFKDFYDNVKYNADTSNPYIVKIKQYADAIDVILSKKVEQGRIFGDELNKFDHEKFYADRERPESEEDYENLDLRYLQQKYPKGT